MTRLEWETLPRNYETGIDRGVLYFDERESIPWDGLVRVQEQVAQSTGNPLYFDGVCYNLEQEISDYVASVEAFIYPYMLEDHILALCDGRTLTADNSASSVFGFSYRTTVLDGYHIHLVYNVTATVNDYAYESLTTDPSLKPFNFTFNTTPVQVPGARPTAHLVIRTPEINESKLFEIEKILYGSESSYPYFPSVDAVVDLFNS